MKPRVQSAVFDVPVTGRGYTKGGSTVGCWVFDLDGTLSDPSRGMLLSLNHALQSDGLAVIPDGEINSYIGPPLEASLAQLAGSKDPALISRLVENYRDHYRNSGYAENVLYDGILPLLEALEEMDAPMGVCTAKTESIARKILQHFGIEQRFRFVSGGDVGVRKGQQLAALLKAGTIDSTALMIGDRKYDLEAAHENALCSCAVQWGFGEVEELTAENPGFLVRVPADLQALARQQAAV